MRTGDVDRVESTAGEEWGPVNALVSSVLSPRRGRSDAPVLGPDRKQVSDGLPELAVTGRREPRAWSGSPGCRRAPTSTRSATPGRTCSPGCSRRRGSASSWCSARPGRRWCSDRRACATWPAAVLEGEDPLIGYPSRAAADLARLGGLPHCGDLVLFSTVDASGRIHAFEDQVGSHGGIGGPQNHAILIHPRDLGPGRRPPRRRRRRPYARGSGRGAPPAAAVAAAPRGGAGRLPRRVTVGQ